MTEPTLEVVDTVDQVVPIADTLDAATLRQVFGDAPADVLVPRDVKSLYRARVRSMGGTNRGPLLVTWLGFLAGGLVVAVAFGQSFGWVLVLLAIVVAVTLYVRAYGRARDDFFSRYATARGLTHSEDGRVDADVPLFRRGDEREWSRVLHGTIAGQPASISHYTYTEVSYDGEGRRQETNHDFTTVCFRLPEEVARRFAGVSLSPRSFGPDWLEVAFTSDRMVELESRNFADRYKLRVVESQDDIALFELFSPPFVHQLATTMTAYWDQRGADLVVWHTGHETETADLDRMCLEAWHVLHRYLEEFR